MKKKKDKFSWLKKIWEEVGDDISYFLNIAIVFIVVMAVFRLLTLLVL